MMITRQCVLWAILILTLSSCANLTSIWRSTPLPGSQGDAEGLAIHLDAKQRIVFAKAFGAVCAEPSPDALSAFAASFGGGAAVPQYGSVAVSQALSESSASIGLRTQSITLMRDALYRICEAYYNRAINQVMVMQLLGRTQDLTLAILAIEQLTQPVVAQQALLTGASSSTSSANLLVNQQLLAAARERERQANEQVVDAKAKRDASAKKVDDKQGELDALKAQNPNDPKIQTSQQELEQAKQELARDDQALKTAEASAKDAKQSRETIEKSRDGAQAAAAANAVSGGILSAPIILKQPPSEQAIGALAGAIKEIVSTVVNKDHKVDACLSFLSTVAATRRQREQQRIELRGKDAAVLSTIDKLEKRDEDEYADPLAVCRVLLDQAVKVSKSAQPSATGGGEKKP